MSEHERLTSQELIRLAEQSRTGELEQINPLIAREMAYRGLLLSNGVYDATLDSYDVEEHPEDERWIIRGED